MNEDERRREVHEARQEYEKARRHFIQVDNANPEMTFAELLASDVGKRFAAAADRLEAAQAVFHHPLGGAP